MRKRFREAAQRRFALVRLLPRGRGRLETAALAPALPEQVASPSPDENGSRGTKTSVSAGALRDTGTSGGQYVSEEPRQQLTRVNNRGKDEQDPQKEEFQSHMKNDEEVRVILHPVQVISGNEQQRVNPETAEVEGTDLQGGLSQGSVTDSGGEKETASVQVIAFSAAGDGSLGTMEGVRGQGVRPRLRLGETESRERGSRIAIIHPARFRRLRFRRPNFGVPKLIPKLVPRKSSGGGIQQKLRLPEGRQDAAPDLKLMEDHQGESLSPASSLLTVGREGNEKQPLPSREQATPTYLPVSTKESETPLSLSEEPQISEGDTDAAVGGDKAWEEVIDHPHEAVQMGLVSETLTQQKESTKSKDHRLHQKDQDTRPGEAEFTRLTQSNKPDTASALTDEPPRALVATSATSNQMSSVSSSSTDDQERQPLTGGSLDQQEHVTGLSSHHQQPDPQQDVTKLRIMQRKPVSGQSVPRLRAFYRPRFSQGTHRGVQAQISRPKLQTKEQPIQQSKQGVAQAASLNTTGLVQTTREERLLPHSVAALREAAQQPEDNMQDEEGLVLHHSSQQQGSNRLSDIFMGGEKTRMETKPPVKSGTFGVVQSHGRPVSTAALEGQTERESPPGVSGIHTASQFQEPVDHMGDDIITNTHSKVEQAESSPSTTEEQSGVAEGATSFMQQKQPERPSSQVTDHQQRPQEQHTPYSHTLMDRRQDKAEPRLPLDIELGSNLPADVSRTYTPTQDAPRAATRESTFTRVDGSRKTPARGKDDTEVKVDGSILAENVAEASPVCEDHTDVHHDSPPARDDESTVSTMSEGRHSSTDQTHTDRVHDEPSEAQWASERLAPSITPLRGAAAETTGRREGQQQQRYDEGNFQSRKSDEVTVPGSSDGHNHAEAYVSHLNTLESELERHVSLLKGHFSLRQMGQSSQTRDGSSIGEKQVPNHRQQGTRVRGSQLSRLQSTEVVDARSPSSSSSYLRDNISRAGGSVQRGNARNDFRQGDQLSMENELRLRGEVVGVSKQPAVGRSRVRYPPTERFRGSDTQRRPQRPLASGRLSSRARSRADGGMIRLRGDHTRYSQPPLTTATRAGIEGQPRVRPHHNLETRRDYLSRQHPSSRGIHVFHSSHDERTTFLDPTAAPKILSGFFASPSQQRDPQAGAGSLARAKQRFVSPEPSPATPTTHVNSGEAGQSYLPVASRTLTNSHGLPGYTFERYPEQGSSKDILSIQNINYHASLGRVNRPGGSLPSSSIYREENPISTQGPPRITVSAVHPPASLGNPQVTSPGQRFKQAPRGHKSSFLSRVEGPQKSLRQRGSRKFLDTLRGLNKDMEEKALLRSLSALLKGQDLSGHWASHDAPHLDILRPPPQLQIPETGALTHALRHIFVSIRYYLCSEY